jgi:hypothetical protein
MDDHITAEELAELRQHGTTVIRNIALFMDNPFAYADKLEEANEQIESLIELRDNLGLEGDGVLLPSTNLSPDLSMLLISAGMAKLNQVLNDLGGFVDE